MPNAVRRLVILLAVIAGVLVVPSVSSAAEWHWTGNVNTDFFQDGNWLEPGFPGNTDIVHIVDQTNDPVISGAVNLSQIYIGPSAHLTQISNAVTGAVIDESGPLPGGLIDILGGTFFQPTSTLGDVTVRTTGTGSFRPTGTVYGGTYEFIGGNFTPDDGNPHAAFSGTRIVVDGTRTSASDVDLLNGASIVTTAGSSLDLMNVTYDTAELVPAGSQARFIDTVVVLGTPLTFVVPPSSTLALDGGRVELKDLSLATGANLSLSGGAYLSNPGSGATLTGSGTIGWDAEFVGPFPPSFVHDVSVDLVVDGPTLNVTNTDPTTTVAGFDEGSTTGDLVLQGGSAMTVTTNFPLELGDFRLTESSTFTKSGIGAVSIVGVNVDGAVNVGSPSSVSVNQGVLRVLDPINLSGSKLTGGRWVANAGTTLAFLPYDMMSTATLTTLDAHLVVTGASSNVQTNHDGDTLEETLSATSVGGILELAGGRSYLDEVSSFVNDGTLSLGPGSIFDIDGLDLVLGSSSVIESRGSTATNNGKLTLSDTDVAANGTIRLDLASFPSAAYSDVWTIINSGGGGTITPATNFGSYVVVGAPAPAFTIAPTTSNATLLVRVAATETGAPTAPSVTITSPNPSNSSSVSASWAASTDGAGESGVVGYDVLYSQSATTSGFASLPVDTAGTTATGTVASPGTWYAHVIALDAEGNASAVAHSGPIVIDQTAPTATLTTRPAALTNSRTATLAFSSTEAGSFACSLDGAAPTQCDAGSIAYTALVDGLHTVVVTPRDVATNVGSAVTHSFTVDATGPVVTIGGATVVGTTGTVAFASEGGATFGCAIDGRAAIACTSPLSIGGLPVGTHTVVITATDLAGNAGAAATATLVVSSPKPTVKPGTARADSIIGSALADKINALAGNDVVKGGAGNDTINGGAGNDKLDGGVGNDTVDGSTGNDTIVGGAGKDKLVGGAGNDVINARDRKAGDVVSCGAGRDRVTADRKDKVARDCEVVVRK